MGARSRIEPGTPSGWPAAATVSTATRIIESERYRVVLGDRGQIGLLEGLDHGVEVLPRRGDGHDTIFGFHVLRAGVDHDLQVQAIVLQKDCLRRICLATISCKLVIGSNTKPWTPVFAMSSMKVLKSPSDVNIIFFPLSNNVAK